MDGVELALLFAQVAADAAHVALAAGIGPALVVRAGDDDIGVVGYGDDDLARAHGRALQAAGALLGIDLRHAVHDVDGVKAAGRDARSSTAIFCTEAGRASMSFGRRSSVFTAKTFEAMASTAPNTAPMMPSTSTA